MTDYTTPPLFEHGDYPVAADLNKYSQGQENMQERAQDYAHRFCTPQRFSGDYLWFVHKTRYLHYKSTGDIINPANLANIIGGDTPNDLDGDVALPNPDGAWFNSYDLEQIPWLTYGDAYIVRGVEAASEETSP